MQEDPKVSWTLDTSIRLGIVFFGYVLLRMTRYERGILTWSPDAVCPYLSTG